MTSPSPVVSRKKLIEVALPLEAINKAAAYEKMPGIGPHPRGLHLWWARRPLAAARAVIFAQTVDDPSSYTDTLLSDPAFRRRAQALLKERQTVWETTPRADNTPEAPAPTLEKAAADLERGRLFKIIEELVRWENTTNESVLNRARDEIWQSWRRTCADNAGHLRAKDLLDRQELPAFHDPFAGGGALPLEAQRLGLEAYASDLNPVAVLINKAMIEIPPKFAERSPVNPGARRGQLGTKTWRGMQGLADDVRYYGKWMRDQAEKRIGHLYPKVEVTSATGQARPDLKSLVGQKLTVIAWLWVRTVKSPNPAFRDVDVPLASTFMLSTKPGKEAWVEPVIEGFGYRFEIRTGKPNNPEGTKTGTKLARGANFRCVMSGIPIAGDYIKAEGKAGRMGARLMAIVAEGERERVYLSPSLEHEAAAAIAMPEWTPDTLMAENPRWFSPPDYGMPSYKDIFTPRQLVALTTLSDLVGEVMETIRNEAVALYSGEDNRPLRDGGSGAIAYAEAIGVYLGFAVDRCCDFSNTCTRWVPGNQKVMNLFGKQAIGMTWDFPEAAILHETVGGFAPATAFISTCIEKLAVHGTGSATQQDAMTNAITKGKIVSTDPPYYDNIGYADLSDFFYVWLRRCLRHVFPDLFNTMTVPKAEELVATPYRHGGREKAERFFLGGMTRAMQRLAEQSHPAFPVSIYYAFKQSETESTGGTSSTGWETFLAAVIEAGLQISGTWPMRSEQEYRMVGMGTNALASSIVLVCRPCAANAPTATRREFVAALQRELPEALRNLQAGNIAPVDLAQAAIGPGMAVFTRYKEVQSPDGTMLSVREALALINETLDTALAEQEGDFDADSRWALAWFDQYGFAEGEFGVANVLAQAKNTGTNGLVQAGIIEAARGKVRLLKPDELPDTWDPSTDSRLTSWEMVHHLVRVLASGGEPAAAALVAKMGSRAENARELAYRLYTVCERRKRAVEALAYNGLVQSWPEIVRLARETVGSTTTQGALFDAL